MKEKWKKYLRLGFDKQTIDQVRFAMDYDNINTVKNVTVLLIFILAILLVFYSLTDNYSIRNILCLFSVFLMVIIYGIARYFIKHKHLCTPANCDLLINVLTGICFAVAIYLGTSAAMNDMAVAPVWMFFFIILIFNRLPIQNITNLMVYGILFMLCSALLKNEHHVQYDFMHAATSIIASAYVSWSKTRLKIQSVLALQHLESDNQEIKETVEKQVQKVDELQKQVKIDVLSGFFKKESFEYEVEATLSHASPKDCHMLLCWDVDNFKAINDTFGHLYGDEVLKEIIDIIRSVFKENALYGRFGGDEFLVFLKDVQNTDELLKKVNEVETKCHKTYQEHGKSITIGISNGYASYGMDGMNYVDLFEVADMKLYKAKRKKKVER